MVSKISNLITDITGAKFGLDCLFWRRKGGTLMEKMRTRKREKRKK